MGRAEPHINLIPTILGTLLIAGAASIAVGAEEDAAAPFAAPAATPVTLASFAGNWQATVIGQTGCGFSTTVYEVSIAASGQGTATAQYHTSGCGDGTTSSPVSFNINSVKADGSGVGGISCGSGCGWVILVQLAPNHQVFNLIDVDPSNPGNFIEGTAVKQ